jgi:uncharacterized phiE125 gp8 family phage protein
VSNWARCGCGGADRSAEDLLAPLSPETEGSVIADLSVPVVEPVTIEEAKLHCRVDLADDDALFPIYIAAARVAVENYCEQMFAAQGYLGRYLPGAASSAFPLGRYPINAVASVERLPADGSSASAISGWRLDVIWGLLYPPPEGWPAAPDTVRVKFSAGPPPGSGEPPAPAPLPPPARRAILGLVAEYYDNRSAAALSGAPALLPHGVEFELAGLRRSTGVVTDMEP